MPEGLAGPYGQGAARPAGFSWGYLVPARRGRFQDVQLLGRVCRELQEASKLAARRARLKPKPRQLALQPLHLQLLPALIRLPLASARDRPPRLPTASLA